MGICTINDRKMRKIVTLISIIAICTFTFAQQNQTDSKGRKQGEWIKYYPNSRIAEYKGTFLDDKPNGTFNYYNKDGSVKMIANHDAKTGRSAVYYYHDNNTIKCFGIYKNMKKDSIWTYFSNTGMVSKREPYKLDLLNGTVYSYYVNNTSKTAPQKVVEETPYVNGKKEGVQKEYFIGGNVKKEANYKNDKLNGWYRQYVPGGALDFEAYYFENQRHGFGIVHTPQGKVYNYYIYGQKRTQEEYKKWLETCKARNIKTNVPTSK